MKAWNQMTHQAQEDAADELYIPTTEDQQTSTNQTNGTSEGRPSSDQSRTRPENNTRPRVIVTQTGRVVKPSSRYKDFLKL